MQGTRPNQTLQQAMSMKSLVIYSLSLTLGIGAVTHADSLLVEQRLPGVAETGELAQRSHHSSRDGCQLSRDKVRSDAWSHAPNRWFRWTV